MTTLVLNLTQGGGSALKLDSISITTPPAKTSYYAGESFNPTGMVVTASYNEGALTGPVTGYTVTPSGPLPAGTSSVTISYAEGGAAKTATVVIAVTKRAVTTPTPGALTYNGTAQAPVWSGYDSATTNKTETAQQNAGNYSTVFSLKEPDYYQWDTGGTADKTIGWSIGKATLNPPTATGTSKTYNGNEQGPAISGYNSATMTQSGTVTAINAGSYTITYALNDTNNYQWTGGTIAEKTISWSIGKATGTMTGVPASVTLNTSAATSDFTIGGNFDGSYTVASSDTSVATVSLVSGKTYRISHANQTTGSANITVTPTGGSNYTTPAAQTIAVTAQFVTIWGVEWDWTSSGPTNGVRTDAAEGFSDPVPYVSGMTADQCSSPFDELMPWAGMTKETRTGGVMVKQPKYWFKWTKTGKKLKLQVANGPVTGFYVDPVNKDRGDGLGELDFSYIGRYHCGTSDWKSTTNVAQKCSITRSAARTGIHKLGTNIWQIDFHQMWYIGMLYLVEFADWNGQDKIGYGCSVSNAKGNNGKTDAMPYHTGTTAASRTTYGYTQYRNIEGWWDNVFDWMDGCYYTSSGLNVIDNPANFSDSANGTLVGLPTSGCPSDLSIPTASGFEWAVYPSTSSGSDSTYVPDSWGFHGSSPCLLRGGNYYRSRDRGPFYVFYYAASGSYDDIGCRLQERPPKTT